MEPFRTHSGRLAVTPDDNVDTDRIIPARFLSRISRSGYGELLFNDVRGENFVLDQPDAKGASILVVGTNFGCGSSREHAVWAIQQGGFRAVVARQDADSPGYSDIFRQNAANCGLLLIELTPADHAKLIAAGTGSTAEIDLPAQTITLGPDIISFDLNAATKHALVEGLDLIGTTLVFDEAIRDHEASSTAYKVAR